MYRVIVTEKLKTPILISPALSFLLLGSRHFMICDPQNLSFHKWDSDL